jgi:hypothetical protein
MHRNRKNRLLRLIGHTIEATPEPAKDCVCAKSSTPETTVSQDSSETKGAIPTRSIAAARNAAIRGEDVRIRFPARSWHIRSVQIRVDFQFDARTFDRRLEA